MEVKQVVSDAHSEPIICITYNPFQQKLFTGSEDGTIKVKKRFYRCGLIGLDMGCNNRKRRKSSNQTRRMGY